MKDKLRKEHLNKRRNLKEEFVKEQSSKIAEHFFALLKYKKSNCIFIYNAIKGEVQTDTIIKKMLKDNKIVALPFCKKNGQMVAKKITKRTILKNSKLNINEPPKNAKIIDPKKIDIIILPGVAFDRTGNRIGMGKGYYDRYLKNTNALKIGFCFDEFLIEQIESEPHDIKADKILTQKGEISLEKK